MKQITAKAEIDEQGRLHVDVPTHLPPGKVEVVLAIHPIGSSNGNRDFSDLAGRLQWQGDAVATQRRLRDEW
jgi:hypothetical protein